MSTTPHTVSVLPPWEVAGPYAALKGAASAFSKLADKAFAASNVGLGKSLDTLSYNLDLRAGQLYTEWLTTTPEGREEWLAKDAAAEAFNKANGFPS